MNKRIAILQFREGYVKINEQLAFKHRLKEHTDDILFINALNSRAEYPSVNDLDGIIIGGSGDNSMTNDHSWYPHVARFVQEAAEINLPILGICFGHQILSRIFGSTVKRDENQKEIGTVEINLNEVGIKDPLFSGVEKTFWSIQGHNDSVINIPDGFDLLAKNDTCHIQAIKMKDRPIYGVQFHPELDQSDYSTRLEYYRAHYVDVGVDYDDLLERGKKPTTDQAILQNFYRITRE